MRQASGRAHPQTICASKLLEQGLHQHNRLCPPLIPPCPCRTPAHLAGKVVEARHPPLPPAAVNLQPGGAQLPLICTQQLLVDDVALGEGLRVWCGVWQNRVVRQAGAGAGAEAAGRHTRQPSRRRQDSRVVLPWAKAADSSWLTGLLTHIKGVRELLRPELTRQLGGAEPVSSGRGMTRQQGKNEGNLRQLALVLAGCRFTKSATKKQRPTLPIPHTSPLARQLQPQTAAAGRRPACSSPTAGCSAFAIGNQASAGWLPQLRPRAPPERAPNPGGSRRWCRWGASPLRWGPRSHACHCAGGRRPIRCWRGPGG